MRRVASRLTRRMSQGSSRRSAKTPTAGSAGRSRSLLNSMSTCRRPCSRRPAARSSRLARMGAEADNVALPTGPRQPSKINDIAQGLGKRRITEGSVPIPASTQTDEAGNGQPLPIDDLQGLLPNEREVVRRSDDAFNRVRQTWPNWKEVGAGLMVLR